MNNEQITFDGIPIPLTMETILNAMLQAYGDDFAPYGPDVRDRQYHAFRARILRLDESKQKHLELYYDMIATQQERLAEKDTRIAELEEELETLREFDLTLLS